MTTWKNYKVTWYTISGRYETLLPTRQEAKQYVNKLKEYSAQGITIEKLS